MNTGYMIREGVTIKLPVLGVEPKQTIESVEIRLGAEAEGALVSTVIDQLTLFTVLPDARVVVVDKADDGGEGLTLCVQWLRVETQEELEERVWEEYKTAQWKERQVSVYDKTEE